MSLTALLTWMVIWPMASAPMVNQTEPPPAWATALTTAALTAYLVTTAVDVGQTVDGVRRGYIETNPLLAGLADHPVIFGAVKIGLAVAVTAVLLRSPMTHWKRTLIVSAILSVVNLVTVVHNQRVIGR